MAEERLGRTNPTRFRGGSIGEDNVVADRIDIPEHGWITRIGVHAGGADISSYAKLAIWDVSRFLRWNSEAQTWLPGRAPHEANVDGLRVSRADYVFAGFWRDPNLPVDWSITDLDKQHRAQSYVGAESPPSEFIPYVFYDGALTTWLDFVRNETPLKPAWRLGTPAGNTPSDTPTFSGTLPHAGEGSTALRSGDISRIASGEYEGEPEIRQNDRTISYARRNDAEAERGPRSVFSSTATPSAGRSRDDIRIREENRQIRAAGDDGYDYSSRVEIVIRDLTTNTTAYEGFFEPSAEENAQGYFTRTFITLSAGHNYRAFFKHYDSWGWASPYSDDTTFTIDPAPDPPTAPLFPVGKIPYGSGFNYRVPYSHVNALSANAIQIEIYNEAGSTRLFNSGTRALTVANGATAELASSLVHATALVEGRKYRFRVRFRDTTGKWGGFSPKFLFTVNARPYVPTNLRPSGGRGTSSTVLQVNVGDADGDLINAVDYILYNATTGVVVKSGSMSVATDGRSAQVNLASPGPNPLVDNTAYRWQARASDGITPGDWSGFATFIYQQVPTVEIRSPKEGGASSPVAQPSAEGDPAVIGPYWTTVGANASNTFTRVADGDAASGVTAWEAVTAGNSGFYIQSPYIDVDRAKARLLTGEFRTRSGTPKTRFRIACYNASNTLLGTVVPTSETELNLTTPNLGWERYGGLIGPAEDLSPGASTRFARQFINGTTKIRIEIAPSATNGQAGTLRWDSIFFPEIVTFSDANFDFVKGLWGYFDPASPFYGKTNDRTWDSTTNGSPYRGPNMLSAPSTSIELGYSSPVGRAKADDRIEIQRWDGKAWKSHYSTVYGGTGGTRTVISIPTASLTNESRFRVRVYVKDTADLESVSEWVEFDVDYTGPGQLAITQVAGNRENATITILHEASDVDPVEFVRKEIQRIEPDGRITTYIDPDPSSTQFTDHFPESGKEYYYRVRQIQRVGNEQLEGRWSIARASVDYFPVFFLKSVADPGGQSIGFFILAGAKPQVTPKRDVAIYETWGSDKPKYGVSPHAYDQGTLTMHLFDAPEFLAGAEEKLATLERMLDPDEGFGTMALLSHKPTRRRFVQITAGPPIDITDYEDYAVSISWSEAFYLEDYYEREEAKKSQKVVWEEFG